MSATLNLVVRTVPPQMWRDTISRSQQSPTDGGLGRARVRAFFAISAHVSPVRDKGNRLWRYKTF